MKPPFGSLIVGGIGGSLVGVLIIEPLAKALFHVEIPCAEIGAGAVFAWPYLSYPFRSAGAKRDLQEQRKSLGCGLCLSLQPKDKDYTDFAEFADEFRAQAEKDKDEKE